MSCCGNCDACRPDLSRSVVIVYACSDEEVFKIAEENPGKTIIVRQWGSDEEYQGKAEAMKQFFEKKQLEIEAHVRKEKIINQGRDQWKHRQKFHSR